MLSVKQQEEGRLASQVVGEASSAAKQLVDIEILYLLTFTPKSGYELRKKLLSWFKINISYGTLYPHLHSLEKMGLILGTWQQKFDEAPLKKRMYSLTPMGQKTLRSNIESLSKISLTMQFRVTQTNWASKSDSAVSPAKSKALELVEGFLSRRGYTVRKLTSAKGISGQEYSVDLFASKQEIKQSNVVIRFSEGPEVSIEDVLKMNMISFELEAQRSILLTGVPRISEDAKKLSNSCHVSIFSGQDFESAAANLCSGYDETPSW
ncbi:MAG TPA: PadR family transcriptional regulator [Nitrososphaerales archaeon]|nr:PadR family transcriptional regulator [Nitrososphaerales archaeon]